MGPKVCVMGRLETADRVLEEAVLRGLVVLPAGRARMLAGVDASTDTPVDPAVTPPGGPRTCHRFFPACRLVVAVRAYARPRFVTRSTVTVPMPTARWLLAIPSNRPVGRSGRGRALPSATRRGP